MKNIHVLPTYKPSRLHFDHSGLFVSPKYQLSSTINSIVQGRNIYITSDEEIKDGDYRYSLIQNNFELVSEFSLKVNKEYWKLNSHIYKKIILTTDQDLIKDGVQAIDDEFLEWFFKNPSCERVKTYYIPNEFRYEIIIPKEEPKPHSFCETPEEKCTMNYCDENGCQNRKKELVEPKKELFEENGLSYWKNNAEEDYSKVPISVLKYISELEKQQEQEEQENQDLKNRLDTIRCITNSLIEDVQMLREQVKKKY